MCFEDDRIVTRGVPYGKRNLVAKSTVRLRTKELFHSDAAFRNRYRGGVLVYFFKVSAQEADRALPGVGGIVRAITALVVRVFEAVPGLGINLDVRFLSVLLQCLFEFLNVFRRNALIFAAEIPKYWH